MSAAGMRGNTALTTCVQARVTVLPWQLVFRHEWQYCPDNLCSCRHEWQYCLDELCSGTSGNTALIACVQARVTILPWLLVFRHGWQYCLDCLCSGTGDNTALMTCVRYMYEYCLDNDWLFPCTQQKIIPLWLTNAHVPIW